MLRLPPRLGAYIQSEHSYQVGSALLWKRRAEAALEALGKAQRQLQACKRREQRLRLRVGELQRERRWDAQGHVQDAHVELGGQGHVGLGLVVAEEQRVPDEVGIKAFGHQAALALLEGGRGLQSVLGRDTGI
uniref:Uncharacterized protein n=1 Tax=Amazona collaria TaxID=241587 RepID=A0A8B9G8U0_9PSIT